MKETSDSEHTGSLIVYKANEVDSEKGSQMTKEMKYFGVVVSVKDKKKILDLNTRFEKILEAYEEKEK